MADFIEKIIKLLKKPYWSLLNMTKKYSYMWQNQCEIHQMVPEYDARTSSSFSKALTFPKTLPFQFLRLNIYLCISMST